MDSIQPIQTRDVFISYSRTHSLHFAASLHQQMVRLGLSCWFDKVNIPHADDYQERIRHGINSAHNFVFIISPSSIRSPYCLKEVALAVTRGKRIIPLLHIMPTTEDWLHLEQGYEQKIKELEGKSPVPSERIIQIKEEAGLTRECIETLQKLDWIYGREEVGDLKELGRWRISYENTWKRHEDPNYLQRWECPVQWKAIDDPTVVIEKLVGLFSKQQNYIQQHTQILLQALKWQKHDNKPNYLLTGVARTESEAWLKMNFQLSELPPCQKTDLQCEFITESRKNAEGNSADVFTSVVRTDRQIRNEVVRELTQRGITCWSRDKNMKKGVEKKLALEAGIEQSDNFFFFVSQASVHDPEALAELQIALDLNKRILPLLVGSIARKEWPETIRKLALVDFTDNESEADFEKDIVDILAILNQDRQYYFDHKRLLVDAMRWQRGAEKNAFLLRGYYLEKAITWFDLHKGRKDSPPTIHHERLIRASEGVKGTLSTDVIICYSRKDDDFARSINYQLQSAGKTTWFDQESIGSAPNYQHELFKGIAKADNVLFILSDDYLDSNNYEEEFICANSLNKRIITIRYREIASMDIPEEVSAFQCLDFENQPFDRSFNELINLLDIDWEHTNQHTVLLERAQEWDAHQLSGDYLLNRSALINANQWLEQAGLNIYEQFPDEALELRKDVNNLPQMELNGLIASCTKKPRPTVLQLQYILSSQQAILKEERHQKIIATRLRTRLRLSVAASILVLMVAVGAIHYYLKAEENRHKAEIAQAEAVKERKEALIQSNIAEEQRHIAETNEELARENEEIAIRQQLIARENEAKAKRQERLANKNAAEARKQRNEAETQRVKAEAAKKEAEQNLADKKAADSKADTLRNSKKVQDLLSLSRRFAKTDAKASKDYILQALELEVQYPVSSDIMLSTLIKVYEGQYQEEIRLLNLQKELVEFMVSGDQVMAISENGSISGVEGRLRLYPTAAIIKGDLIATADRYGQVAICAMVKEGGKVVLEPIGKPRQVHDPSTAVSTLIPFGKGMLSAGFDGTIKHHLDLQAPNPEEILYANRQEKILCLDSQQDQLIAFGTKSGKVGLFRLGQEPVNLLTFDASITSIHLNEAGKYLLCGLANGHMVKVAVYKDLQLHQDEFYEQKAHEKAILNIDVSGTRILTAGNDGKVILRFYDDLVTRELGQPIEVQNDMNVKGHARVRFSEEGNHVYTMDDETVNLWPIDEALLRAKFPLTNR